MVRLGRITTAVASATVLFLAVPPAFADPTEPAAPDGAATAEPSASPTPSPEPTPTASPSAEPTEPAPPPTTPRPRPTRTPRPPGEPAPGPTRPTGPAEPEPTPPSPSASPSPSVADIPASGLQIPAVGGITDAEIAILQDRVAELQAELDELAAAEDDAQKAAVRARDDLAAADQAAVRAAESVAAATTAATAAEDDLAAARDELEDARRVAELADDALAEAEVELEDADRTMRRRIRATFMEGGHLGLSTMILGIEDFNMVLRVTHMIEAAVDEDHATVAALDVARSVRQERLAAAAAAEIRAGTVETRVADAQERAIDAQAEAEAAAEQADRTAARLAQEVARLEEASSEVSRPRLELEARLGAAKAALEAALAGDGDVELVTVWADRGDGVMIGGITVSTVIGQQLQDLLAAAAADGIVLGGGGYRTPMTTVRLREANGCPDIYDSPASACRIPTAVPGRSMHERGLAIDFSYQGRTLCFGSGPKGCRGNAAFDWLAANAQEYGLVGSSVEAWHWSINGN